MIQYVSAKGAIYTVTDCLIRDRSYNDCKTGVRMIWVCPCWVRGGGGGGYGIQRGLKTGGDTRWAPGDNFLPNLHSFRKLVSVSKSTDQIQDGGQDELRYVKVHGKRKRMANTFLQSMP